MIKVIITIVLLILLVVVKKIPFVRGNVAKALIIAGLVSLILGSVYNPIDWIKSWAIGLDRLAWVMALSLIGSFYGKTQEAIGALDVVVELFRSLFGKSKRGLIVAIILAVAVGGEAFGDSIAAASVIGILVIPALSGIGMNGEQIAATICFGALGGSIMPPISQAVYLSCSILGIGTHEALRLTYITAFITMVISTAFAAFTFVDKGPIPEELKPKRTSKEIIKEGYKSLTPLAIIVVMLILNSGFGINVGKLLIGPVYNWMVDIPVIRGLTNSVVMILLIASIITFIWKEVRSDTKNILVSSVQNVRSSLTVQACAAFFIGAIYTGGQIEVVTEFARSLDPNMIKISGAFALLVMATITGSQTSGQNIIFTFLGPMLIEIGVNPSHAAIVGSHIASAGQASPPVALTPYVVCSNVESAIDKKVNPIKSMLYILPLSISLAVIGFLFMYI